MGYTLIKSFDRGVDTRKLLDTTEPGTLIEGRDCHITLGGEIEKRAAYMQHGNLPANTVGFWVTEGRVFHTWGDVTPAPAGLPAGTIYHYVPAPSGASIEHILSVEQFNGGLYTVIQYAGNLALHWWAADLVNDVLVVIPENDPVVGGGDPPTTAPGNKPQATMTIFLYRPPQGATPDITINGVYLIKPGSNYVWGVDAWLIIPQTGTSGGTNPWPTGAVTISAPTDPGEIAAKIMSLINAFVPPGTGAAPVIVKMQASGASMTFWIEFPGPTYNGWTLKINLSGGPSTAEPGGSQAFSGGTAGGAVIGRAMPVLLVGAPGDPIQKGNFARAHNYRMFCTQDTLLNYSKPKDTTIWSKTSVLANFIDHSMLTASAPHLVSMGDYSGDLAVFGLRHIFIWNIDVLPDGDSKRQTIHGTGTFAPHSVVPYGVGDVMYLDVSGIRSLRARTGVDTAFAADIGNLIDPLVRAKIAVSTEDQKLHHFWGVVEPRSGRLWMAMYDKIFVLSDYPSSRISAWTWYDATSAPVDMMCTSDNSVYWRSVNTIYIYGGESGDQYDDTQALVRLPYIDGGKPATMKNWSGIDLALTGRWQVRGSFDPMNPTALDLLANLDKSTYAQQKIAINGESPALSLELESAAGWFGRARIGNAALHFSDGTSD